MRTVVRGGPHPAPPRKNDLNHGQVAGQNKGLILKMLVFFFPFWYRNWDALYLCQPQGGRSCAGARGAPAKKFGLGRKF